MGTMTINRFKAEFKIVLFRDLALKISFYENEKQFNKDDLGKRYLMCNVSIKDLRNNENYAYQYYFPLDIEIESSIDLFKNELRLILNSWKKCCPIDWVRKSNPECAWIYYKRTFDKVMQESEILNNVEYFSEIECKQSEGNSVMLKRFADGAERLFQNDEYLGRVDTIKSENIRIEYFDCKLEDSTPPFFLCDTNKMRKFPGAEYKPLLGNKDVFLETGIHIYHTGSLRGIVEGAAMAAKEFKNRK